MIDPERLEHPAVSKRPAPPELEHQPAHFQAAELVSFISTNLTLLPGDVILTGTPSGVGPIQSGDKLEVRIQGLAPLVNSVK